MSSDCILQKWLSFHKIVTLLPPPPVTHTAKSEHPSMVYVTKSKLLRWLLTVIVQFKISI
jgi:hypothetical protein